MHIENYEWKRSYTDTKLFFWQNHKFYVSTHKLWWWIRRLVWHIMTWKEHPIRCMLYVCHVKALPKDSQINKHEWRNIKFFLYKCISSLFSFYWHIFPILVYSKQNFSNLGKAELLFFVHIIILPFTLNIGKMGINNTL